MDSTCPLLRFVKKYFLCTVTASNWVKMGSLPLDPGQNLATT